MRITRHEQNASAVQTVTLGLSSLFILVLGFDVPVGVNIADYTLSTTLGLTLIIGLFYRSQKKRVSQGADSKL